MRLILIAILSMLVTLPSVATDKEEILKVDRAFSAMSKAKGTKTAYLNFLSKNAVQLSSDEPPIRGLKAITAGMEDSSSSILYWTPQDGKVADSGDLAYSWGLYTSIYEENGEKAYEYGKYATVWVKEDGKWKAVLDAGNPGPAPK